MSSDFSSRSNDRPVGRLLSSFRFAWRGIGLLLRTQANARIHAAATVLVVLMGLMFHLTLVEWALIVLAIAGVWAAEGMNTAIEFLVDLVSPEYHVLAEQAKDVAAGAVLLAAVGAAIVGMLVFGPFVLGFLGV